MSAKADIIPSAFIWRRLHSLLGLWLVIYLIEHLLTNSQAALWIGDDGAGFVRMVNLLQNLPYLRVIEIVLLGVPILLHGVWGVQRLFTAKLNSFPNNGSTPNLSSYSRNHAYTWQRITSWVLLFGIILHVVQMRFLEAPIKTSRGIHKTYLVKLNFDEGLYTLLPRLGVKIYNRDQIEGIKQDLEQATSLSSPPVASKSTYDPQEAENKEEEVLFHEDIAWLKSLESFSLKGRQIIAEAPSSGVAILLSTRDTFKNPLIGVLYTIFVLAAVFHAFNGFWTFLITWGVILSMKSQKMMVKVFAGIMVLFLFLGFAAIWGSYWINLRN